jgi:hypothetical protein
VLSNINPGMFLWIILYCATALSNIVISTITFDKAFARRVLHHRNYYYMDGYFIGWLILQAIIPPVAFWIVFISNSQSVNLDGFLFIKAIFFGFMFSASSQSVAPVAPRDMTIYKLYDVVLRLFLDPITDRYRREMILFWRHFGNELSDRLKTNWQLVSDGLRALEDTIDDDSFRRSYIDESPQGESGLEELKSELKQLKEDCESCALTKLSPMTGIWKTEKEKNRLEEERLEKCRITAKKIILFVKKIIQMRDDYRDIAKDLGCTNTVGEIERLSSRRRP